MSTDDDGVWVGLDLGTQSVRAVAVTGSGAVLGSGSAPLTSRRDAGRHEQDPDAWWAGVAAAAGTALRGVRRDRVRGVAVDGTSGTVLLVGADGRQLTPALMYDDDRAAEQAVAVNEV
ncbi:MAG: hypothetical protein AVDCRST_MAG07-3235, partial [uncultured Frankineae bacterium]